MYDEGNISQTNVVEDFLIETTQGGYLLESKGKRRGRNGVSKECRRCYPDTVEEGYQEETQKKKGREEGEEDEEGRVRNEIIEEVIEGIQKKGTDESAENK